MTAARWSEVKMLFNGFVCVIVVVVVVVVVLKGKPTASFYYSANHYTSLALMQPWCNKELGMFLFIIIIIKTKWNLPFRRKIRSFVLSTALTWVMMHFSSHTLTHLFCLHIHHTKGGEKAFNPQLLSGKITFSLVRQSITGRAMVDSQISR